MASLQLSAGSEFELWDAINPTKHMLSRVGEQMQDLNDVFGSFEGANFLNVVLGDHSALTLLSSIWIIVALWRYWVRSIWISLRSSRRHSRSLSRSLHVGVLSIQS